MQHNNNFHKVGLLMYDGFDNRFLQFEKAYCEYRLNRTEQALSTLRSVTNLDVRTKELLAQVVGIIFLTL